MSDVTKIDEVKCSICEGYIEPKRDPVTKEVYWTQGHNAEPVTAGRCCDTCNSSVVVPTRIRNMGY